MLLNEFCIFDTVVLATVPPQITQPPQHTSGTVYSTTNLTCKAIGAPIPRILWYKDNVLIPNDNTDVSVLLFPELDLNNRGFYHCEARSIINGNNVSVMSSKVLLNISGIKNMFLNNYFYSVINRYCTI